MRRLRVGGRMMRVRDEGEGPRLPLVCVHGAGSSSVIFMDLVRRLSGRRRIVAPDLPGHGQSERGPTPPSIESYRDALGAMLDELAMARAVLLGHSMGGLVALATAAAFPDRVAGLVLVNSAARIEVSPQVRAWLRDDFPRFGKRFAKLAWSPATALDVIERWGAVALTADQETTEADFDATAAFDATALLPAIGCPALVLAGADDALTSPAAGQALAHGIRGARAIVVPEAGHMLAQERPEIFYAELEAFLIAAIA